jgi:hypothetical protein
MARRAPTAYRPSETAARNRLIDLFAAAAGGFTAQNYAEGGPLVTSDHPAAVAPANRRVRRARAGSRFARTVGFQSASWARAPSAQGFSYISVERNRRSRVSYLGTGHCKGCAMRGSQIKLQSESPAIGGIYLGVTVSGVSALVAMGVVVLALM